MLEQLSSPALLKGLTLSQKQALAQEIRDKIIKTVSENGGHLASNLGAVELTIALHSVLDAPRDQLIFDVGHQCYTHKLLTGRYEAFGTLRQQGGLSGFTRPDESAYDLVASGHASDSLSLALGLARARDLQGDSRAVVAVLGDGALTGGMCYEALNDAGQRNTRLVIVLNDNEMSISKNVGSMSKYLTHMRQSSLYRRFKQRLRQAVNRMPKGGGRMERLLTRIKEALKTLLVGDRFFDSLDIDYLGPIDGHDIEEMEKIFKSALTYDRPVVVHVVTKKGKGYPQAEDTPDKYHALSPKNAAPAKGRSCAALVGKWLVEAGARDEKLACISAAMLSGTGLATFERAFPERCFDVGIAEEHAAALAAGMAINGVKPYLALYSTFLQRACDQINITICLNRAPVRLLIDRGGLNGPDGETHQGVFDLGLLRALPGLTLCAPSSLLELKAMLDMSLEAKGPFAIRYPKALPEGDESETLIPYSWGWLKDGQDACLISYGQTLPEAMEAEPLLEKQGVSVCVVSARFLKPIDEASVKKIFASCPRVFVAEDSVFCGSLYEELSALRPQGTRVYGRCVPDQYIPQGSVLEQLRLCGLDARSLCAWIEKELASEARHES